MCGICITVNAWSCYSAVHVSKVNAEVAMQRKERDDKMFKCTSTGTPPWTMIIIPADIMHDYLIKFLTNLIYLSSASVKCQCCRKFTKQGRD